MSALARWTPGALYGAPLRWTDPALAGRGRPDHIALTLDDGPDPLSTPAVLEVLTGHDVRATFFVMGEHLTDHALLVRALHERGHEVAVHGWSHRAVPRLSQRRLTAELVRTAELITTITGERPRFYRPPYGITTRACLQAARDAGLRPVLWTAWGRDWSAHVDASGIARRVRRTLRGGGTVLLHDTDRYAAPGSWRRTAEALDVLLREWRAAGWQVGPLGEHGLLPVPVPERE